MAVLDNISPVDFKPIWQPVEGFSVVSTGTSSMTAVEDGSDYSLFYINGSNFWEHDTRGNGPQRLASPIVNPAGFVSTRYTKYGGNRGRVISCPSSTSIRIAGLNGGIFKDKVIKITHGKGAGQSRTITVAPEATTYDQGLATAAGTSSISDSTKKWKFNQWTGFQVRFTFGAGNTLVRKILYNDATTIYWQDNNYQAIDSWNNSFLTVAPSATAGSQTHFIIEATDFTIDSAWTVTPNDSSRFVIESGGMWMYTQQAAAPFYNIQYYDRAGDYWQQKTSSTNFVLSSAGVYASIERTGEIGGVYHTGTATSGTNYTLVNTGATGVIADEYRNYRIRIIGGTGIGQSRRIVGNGTNYFEINRKWQTNPDSTSQYEIIADRDKIYMAGNSTAAMFQHDVDSDLPIQGSKIDDGIAVNMSLTMEGVDQPIVIGVSSATKQASDTSITAVNTTPVAGGTGYTVGDILTLATGTAGKVIVETTGIGGIVTSVSLLSPGTVGYSVATFATTGGTGTGCTIGVTSIGRVGAIVTAINHPFSIGDSVTFAGASESAWNTTYTILGVDSLTAVFFVITATATASASASNSATLIVDSSKNWTPNEMVGKIVQTHLLGVNGAVQPRVITANTATTLTVATITTALVNGTGRYVITELEALGRDDQFRIESKWGEGTATGGTATTLVDSTKNWTTDQWAGARLRIRGGTGRNVVAAGFITVTGNTSNTLTFTSPGFTPDTTTKYIIEDSFGICTGAGTATNIVDTTKKWIVNQWAGKRLRITGGAGFGLAAANNEIIISSNTANTLVFSTVTGFAPDATTTYTILGVPNTLGGSELVWIYGGVSKGKYIFRPRGGGVNAVDRYNISTEKYEYGAIRSPNVETFNTGAYFAYDGSNRIYFSPNVAQGAVQYVMYYDLLLNKTFVVGSVPNTQLAPVLGNRMEIITSPKGIKYLYHQRNSGVEMYRTPIIF